MAIRCKLSRILGDKRISQKALAEATGLAKGTVTALYHDRVRKVDYGVLDKICRFLGCQPGDLLVYEPNEETPPAKDPAPNVRRTGRIPGSRP